MEDSNFSRRNFLRTAAIGSAAVAAGQLFAVSAKTPVSETKPNMTEPTMKMYLCTVCGHIEFGSTPEHCPVCHAAKDKFVLNNTIFSDAKTKFPGHEGSHDPVITAKKESGVVAELPCHQVDVRVGKTMHPMEEAHHIQFLDLYMDEKHLTRIFVPLSLYPAASLYLKTPGSKFRVVELCNLHGYWQSEVSLA